MKNKLICVNIGYPSEFFNKPDAILEELAEKFCGNRNGSGCGFGQRDMHFDFPSKKQAKDFIKECRGWAWGFEIIAELDE